MRKIAFPPVLLSLSLCPVLAFPQPAQIDGVDFADQPGVLYVPAKMLATQLAWTCDYVRGRLILNGHSIAGARQLFDGTELVPLRTLGQLGATVAWDPALEQASIEAAGHSSIVHRGNKYAFVSKNAQELRAYQGSLLVLRSHVSTGRKGHGTPNGDFAAARKERLHLSSIYDDSPMPYAVQIHGNIFVHGFTSVPRFPASHGCIRMPLKGKNPARYFWSWVNIGTPVTVVNDWPQTLNALMQQSSYSSK